MDTTPNPSKSPQPTRVRATMGPFAGVDKRKQSLYIPTTMLEEVQTEALRQDRSLSWVIQKSWELSRERIKQWSTDY